MSISCISYIDNLFFGDVYHPFKGLKCMIQIFQTQENSGDFAKPLKTAQKLANPEK